MSGTAARVVRAALGLVLVALVLVAVNPGDVARRLVVADVGLAIFGVLGLTAMHVVAASGWRMLIGVLSGARLAWRAALPAYYAAQAIGGLTPANLGGDAHRAVAMRVAGLGWSAAVAPVVAQRATSYAALAALSLVSIAFLATSTRLASVLVLLALAPCVLVGAAAWLLLAPPGRLRVASRALLKWVGGGSPMATAASGVEIVGAGRPRWRAAALVGTAHGLAFHAGSIGFTALLVLAISPAAPLVPVLAGLAVARLSLALPITPSGLGVQEGAFVALTAGVALEPQAALGAMLLARVSLLLTTAVGAALLAAGQPRLAPARRAARAVRG